MSPSTSIMFTTAETGASVGKEEFDERMAELRVELLNAQYDLRHADFSVLIVLGGDDWLAVEEVLEGLGEWMDGRFIHTHAMGEATEEERLRPPFWRYWRRLPAHGEVAVFVDAWSTGVVRDRVAGELKDRDFEEQLRFVSAFEAELAANGTEVLKFWLHLPKAAQKKRIKRARKSARGAWRLTPAMEQLYEHYDEVLTAGQRLIEVTDEADRPWHLVESTDRRHLALSVAEVIHTAIRTRLDRPTASEPQGPAVHDAHGERASILATVDLGATLARPEYRKELDAQQERLFALGNAAHEKGIATVLAFEGWDAAGKGGVIRRVMAALDLRNARVVPIAAPTDEEAARHYLWRFWRQIPAAGRTVIFDRTWYGRVLVERVEGYASEQEWRRAYSEINGFEEALSRAGVVVQKFWLHIDPDEQLARFKAREETPFKAHKITDEDWRNRDRWNDYVAAVDEMVARTSTSFAPWHLISANDKRHARVEVVKRIGDALEERL